jgi:hypothetical protein
MKTWHCFVLLAAAGLARGADAEHSNTDHPPMPKGGTALERSELTESSAADLPYFASKPAVVQNYVDEFVFKKTNKDRIPRAALCSDIEFLRRVTLDLTGRLPEPENIRRFVADTDPRKRDKLVDEFMKATTKGMTVKPSTSFLDRWTYFFADLFRLNNSMGAGRILLHRHIYNALTTNEPYDEFVRGLLTATARSNFDSAQANFLIRFDVDQPDQSTVNHEDTYDEMAIRTSRMFLGMNLECISCHDGAGHLEKINLWLTGKKRTDLWRQAAFFGKVRMYRPYGDLVDEFVLNNEGTGYDTASKSVVRLPRYKADTRPTFILTGEHPREGEDPRDAYARMVTGNRQFSRTIVNNIWAELFGAGIVDPPTAFDLVRYGSDGSTNGGLGPLTQYAELLDAMAKDFEEHHYDLRHLIRTIVTSSTYQLSHRLPQGGWKAEYADYFARHLVRRLPAEQVWDALSDATGIYDEMPIGDSGRKVKYVLQTVSPEDIPGKLRKVLASFGLDDRTLGTRSLSGSPVQASILLNSDLVKEKIKSDKKGRLWKLMHAEPPNTNEKIVEEIFLATLSRFPSAAESRFGGKLVAENHDAGAEDLLWALLNRPEFLLNY